MKPIPTPSPNKPAPLKSSHAGSMHKQAQREEAVNPNNVPVTVCPCGKDYRWTVKPEEVERVFSALRPGQYIDGSRA